MIALGQPTVGEPELAELALVLKSGWLAGNGPASRRFEAAFALVAGTSNALAVSNCTAALHLAFMALGLGPGDEVIVADYTFPATGHAVMFTGATPIFADVRPDIWTIDPECVESLITSRTVGLVAVDVFGQVADYNELRLIADRHRLWFVEDAAAAAGATYYGRPAGSLADVACFSFHGRKGITAGEGGALTTDLADVAAVARRSHAFGIESALTRSESSDLPIPEFRELGYNYKLSDLAAAVMCVQLDRLSELLAARRCVASTYAELLADVEMMALPATGNDREHSWQTYAVTLDESVDRGAMARSLRGAGVQCNFGTYASHRQPVYRSTQHCPVSASMFDRHLAIPMHANLSERDIEQVTSAVRTALRQ